MVLQTIVQGNQKDGKTNWWSIDFGPIVEYARFPHMSPQRVFMVRYHHQFLLPWSKYILHNYCLSLDVLCHNCFMIRVLRKWPMTKLCYMLVVGQGLSVQRTLPYTYFPHIVSNCHDMAHPGIILVFTQRLYQFMSLKLHPS